MEEQVDGFCHDCLDNGIVGTCQVCQKLITNEIWDANEAWGCEDCQGFFCLDHIAHIPHERNPEPDLVLCVHCYPKHLNA